MWDKRTAGLTAIAACAVLWSTGGLFIKLVDWHPLVIAGTRSLVAAVFLAAAGRVGRKPGAARAKKTFAHPAAAACLAATMLLFVTANKLTTSANAILLQYCAPAFAALFGWALAKERPRAEQWAALAAVSAGLLLFFKDSLAAGSLAGDLMAVAAGITFGAYSVFMRLQKDGDPGDSIVLAHVATAAIGLPFAFVAPPTVTVPAVAAVLALGVLQIGVASLFFAYGIKRVSAVQAMLTAVIEPVLNPVWVLLATGEAPASSAIAGGAVIVAAVTVSSIVSLRRRA